MFSLSNIPYVLIAVYVHVHLKNIDYIFSYVRFLYSLHTAHFRHGVLVAIVFGLMGLGTARLRHMTSIDNR